MLLWLHFLLKKMAANGNTTRRPTTTEFLEAAKDFSHDQKLSVVQSILVGIPREQQQPWHMSKEMWEKQQRETNIVQQQAQLINGERVKPDDESVDSFETQDVTRSIGQYKPKAPPLIDPYEKSMKYYEKHLVLNHFQHMTAKLVLHRPENALQYMIDWCKGMQKTQAAERLKSKALYEENKIDVYDEDITKALRVEPTDKKQQSSTGKKAYGNNLLKQTTSPPPAKDEGMVSQQSADTGGGDSIRVRVDNQDSAAIIASSPKPDLMGDQPSFDRSFETVISDTGDKSLEAKTQTSDKNKPPGADSEKKEEDEEDILSVSDVSNDDTVSVSTASEAAS